MSLFAGDADFMLETYMVNSILGNGECIADNVTVSGCIVNVKIRLIFLHLGITD